MVKYRGGSTSIGNGGGFLVLPTISSTPCIFLVITDSQIRGARQLIDGGEPMAQVARDLGMSRATFYCRSRALAPFAEPSDGPP
ncbi:hypothetical protein B7R22_18255 [Subtercola boreus]|uniref:Resolvase HTH domain-containing protein n=1 Tax=Subtercola boreus TaxID=120213 RepID=A0A3E0VPW7_9MICO|nr:hypothetical protein B7R22_18255 [Subtercola boreus]